MFLEKTKKCKKKCLQNCKKKSGQYAWSGIKFAMLLMSHLVFVAMRRLQALCVDDLPWV